MLKKLVIAAVAVFGLLAFAGTASAQYGYGGSYRPYYGGYSYTPSYYQPYYAPTYTAPKPYCYTPPAPEYKKPDYCPAPAMEKKESAEDVLAALIKEAQLRKAISELPADQQLIMLKRLGWYKEPAPGSAPPLSATEIELLKALLQKK